jgi:hypothetical protein
MYSVVFNKFICYKKNSLLIKRLFVPIKGKKKKVDNENGLNKTTVIKPGPARRVDPVAGPVRV